MIDDVSYQIKHVDFQDIDATRFKWLPQNQLTNSLPKTCISDGISVDKITGDAELKRNNFTLYIHQYSELTVKELRASFYRMVDIILMKFSEGFNPQKTIKISLREYMAICNLDSINKARIQLNADLEIFYRVSVSYQSLIKSDSHSEMRLCQDFEIKNSVIHATLGDKFYNMLLSKNMKRMLIPVLVLQCNFKKNPNSYFIGRKLSEYERVNFNKKHNCVISIKSLLKACPNLKNWEKSKHKKRDVVQAFYRDMVFLEEQIGWHYCKAKGEALSDDETKRMGNDDFSTFIDLYIQYTFEKEYRDLMNAHIKPLNIKAIKLNSQKKFKRKKK